MLRDKEKRKQIEINAKLLVESSLFTLKNDYILFKANKHNKRDNLLIKLIEDYQLKY